MTVQYCYTDTIQVEIFIEQDSVEEAKQSFENVVKRIGGYAEQCDPNVVEATGDAVPFDPDFVYTRGEDE